MLENNLKLHIIYFNKQNLKTKVQQYLFRILQIQKFN